MIIVHDLWDLQTKGKFACPACGPKMKSHHSRSLQKQVFNEFRHFLHNNHKYQITKNHLFNGKEETTSRLQRMTPHLWKLEYDWLNHRGNGLKFIFWYYFLFSNDVIDAREGHQGINDQLLGRIKSYPSQFSRLSYYQDPTIVHLFYSMHIGWKAWQRKNCQNL